MRSTVTARAAATLAVAALLLVNPAWGQGQRPAQGPAQTPQQQEQDKLRIVTYGYRVLEVACGWTLPETQRRSLVGTGRMMEWLLDINRAAGDARLTAAAVAIAAQRATLCADKDSEAEMRGNAAAIAAMPMPYDVAKLPTPDRLSAAELALPPAALAALRTAGPSR